MRPMLQRPGLIGRSAELALLQEELESAVRGSGRCVVIHGEPGVGKTRLLGEFLLTAKRRSLVLGARAYPLGTTTPFALISDALEDHLHTLPAAERERLANGSPALGTVLPSLAQAAKPADGLSRTHVLEELTRLVQDLAAERPVVVALDDVHLADPSTWEAFHHLARHAADHRILLLVALRSESLAASPSLADLIGSLTQDWVARELVLAPLDRSAMWELARRALGRDDIPASVAEWLFLKSLGNPLYAMGYLQALAERGDDLDPSALDAVPDTLRRRVGARIGGLPPAARGALEAAAVIGQRAPPGLIGDVAATAPGELAPILDDLVARRFLDDDAAPAGVVYDFVHPLVQEAVYEAIGPLRRRELHLAAGRAHVAAGRAGAAAAHFARGAEPGDAEALALIVEAAREAESKQAHNEAVGHLTAALALTTDPGERRTLLDELAWQANLSADFAAGIPALRELDRLLVDSGDLGARTHTQLRLTSLLSSGSGDQDQARRALEEAERLADEAGDELLQARAANERSWLVGIGGDLPGQVELARQAVVAARRLGDRELELHALGSLGCGALAAGDFDESAEALTSGLELARAAQDFGQTAWHGSQAALATAFLGQVDEGLSLARAVRQEVPETHHAHLLEFEGLAKWLAGRWEEAAVDCELKVGTWSPAGMSVREVSAPATAILCLAEMARLPEAAAIAARIERRGLPDFYWMTPWYRHSVAALNMAEGRAEDAATGFAAAARSLEAMGSGAFAPLAWVELADVAAQLHDVDRVELAAERIMSSVARLRPRWYQGLEALAASWLAEARGVLQQADDAAGAAVDALAESPFKFYAARSLETRGRIAAASGDAGRATPDLTSALALYRELPAPARADGVLRRLERLGAEGRRLASRARGASALSPRERAVAALAARGLTAKEIAQRLFIGERTVESHLASAYSKLGLASKRELMSRARELQLDTTR